MNLEDILKYAIAIVSFLIIVAVLLQTRSGGLGTVFGGSTGGEFYKSRRGFEAFLYNSTVLLGILFAVISIAIAIINA